MVQGNTTSTEGEYLQQHGVCQKRGMNMHHWNLVPTKPPAFAQDVCHLAGMLDAAGHLPAITKHWKVCKSIPTQHITPALQHSDFLSGS